MARRKETSTKTSLAPQKQEPVTFVDVGTKDTARTGGYTIIGNRTGGGSSGGGGGGSSPSIVDVSGITQEQAEKIEAKRRVEIIQKEQAQKEKIAIASKIKADNQAPSRLAFLQKEQDGKVVQTQYFKEGKEVGKIVTDPKTGEQYVETQATIPQEVTIQRRGFTRRVVFSQEGASVFDTGTSPVPFVALGDTNTSDVFTTSPQQLTSEAKSFMGNVGDFLFSREGFKIIPIFSIASPTGKGVIAGRITPTQFSEAISTTGTTGKVASYFIPKTLFESSLLLGGVGVYSKLPSIARIGASAAITGTETSRVLNPTLPKEQRIASGIVGGLAATGTFVEALPYARGLKAKASFNYAPIKTQSEGFKAIELSDQTKTRIGLILPKSPAKTGATAGVELPSASPLVRGGFGRKSGGESIFLGKGQTLATSQVGLFKQGVDIPIEREFFLTPQEPFLKIPETRLSRLGLQEPFSIPKETTLGFGLSGKPQIALFPKTSVGRFETTTQTILGKGGELETLKTFGAITGVKKVGVTTIKGQGVELYTAQFGKGTLKSVGLGKQSTTEGLTRVSGEGALSTIGFKTKTKTQTLPTQTLTQTLSLPTSTTKQTIKTFTGITTPKTTTGTQIKTPSTSPPTTSIITPPITPRITPPRTPPKSPPLIPRLTPPISPPRSPPTRPPTKPPIYPPFKFKGIKQKASFGKFPVQIRRQGKWKIVGFGRTPLEAVSIGEQAVSKTLARSFRIPTGVKPFKIQGYKTKKEKVGIVYIEPSKRALSSKSERKEIQFFKALRGRKRKKSRFDLF